MIPEEGRRPAREKDTVVLAHSYQDPEIVRAADAAGDSFALARAAERLKARRAVVCGVRFMAECVKILSPGTQVILAREAGCPMAEQLTPEQILAEKAKHPGCAVVCYINTMAAIKAVCDVCVTSSCAERVVRALPQVEILFLPDPNLGAFLAGRIPEKRFFFLGEGCPVHTSVGAEEAARVRAEHPGAPLWVHPECRAEVCAQAQLVGSTKAILEQGLSFSGEEAIIGTESSIARFLQSERPDKRFYPLSEKLVCPDMRKTTREDLERALAGRGGVEIDLPEPERRAAEGALRRMMELA